MSHIPVIRVMEMDKEENIEQQDSISSSVCLNICGVYVEIVEVDVVMDEAHLSPVWKVKAGQDLRGASLS